jgi:hypothetical protein
LETTNRDRGPLCAHRHHRSGAPACLAHRALVRVQRRATPRRPQRPPALGSLGRRLRLLAAGLSPTRCERRLRPACWTIGLIPSKRACATGCAISLRRCSKLYGLVGAPRNVEPPYFEGVPSLPVRCAYRKQIANLKSGCSRIHHRPTDSRDAENTALRYHRLRRLHYRLSPTDALEKKFWGLLSNIDST